MIFLVYNKLSKFIDVSDLPHLLSTVCLMMDWASAKPWLQLQGLLSYQTFTIYTMILRVYLIQLYDVDTVEFRTRILIHCDALLCIDKGSRHQVRPVCPYWLRANLLIGAWRTMMVMHAPHCVHNRSLGQDWKI